MAAAPTLVLGTTEGVRTMTVFSDEVVERLREELAVHDERYHPGMIGHGMVWVRADDLRAVCAALEAIKRADLMDALEACLARIETRRAKSRRL